MLPTTEIDALTNAVTAAVDLARAGQFAAGYTALLAGKLQAQERAVHGAAWREELRALWSLTCENYVRRWGVSLEADN